jgi:hypothetical protein
VTLNGLPERLLIARHDEFAVQQPGARLTARVRRIERPLNSAFLDLGEGPDALLPLSGGAQSLAEGAWIDVEIAAAARRGKGSTARFLGAGEGPHRVLIPAPALQARLSAFAPGETIVGGAAARAAADMAEDAALAVEHALPGGGRLFVEPTQALVAVDVDLSATPGDPRRAAVKANLEALDAAARLLRLKGLGGLVAIDLAGRGHDGARLSAAAKAAFAPEGVAVSIGPISRFGVMELALPWQGPPIADRLLDGAGRPTPATLAYRLLRMIEGAAAPGVLVEARCAPPVAAIAEGAFSMLIARIGPRFDLRADASLGPEDMVVRAR